MKTPQLENGFIRIANEIWEALGSYRLSGEEWLILNCVIRKTYGFQKKQDYISLSQFQEYTKLNRPAVARAIKKLVSKKILGSIKKDTSCPTLYWFNKLFKEWIPSIKKDTTSKTSINKDTRASINKDNHLVSIKIHTKDNIQKTILKKYTRIKNSCPFKEHKPCIEFLDKLAKQKNLPHGWINFPKQMSFLHKLLKLGYSYENIEKEAIILDKDNFMWDKWDLATICGVLEKKGREVIYGTSK